MPRPIHVMFFCLGNICRSPLAEALFRYHVQQADLEDSFVIESSGTSDYHVGEPPDPGSVRVARQRLGLNIEDQRAQQLRSVHFERFDYLVAMDRSNRRNALGLAGADEARVLLLRDWEPEHGQRGQDVPDPWGGGPDHFEQVYDIVYRCTHRLLEHLVAQHELTR